jgi:conjugative relaxase-like TrwC/TraI family protein
MLRIIQSTNAGQAKSYYSSADYYSEGQELTGRWRGEASRMLGLAGDVKQADWDALCENRNPSTGERLTRRTNTDRTIGYDFNFHVPKSVSLLYAHTRDERLLDAFRDAVDGTMHDMEAEMSARVRKAGKQENRRTGNLAWGEFIHFTSRPVDGVPDPHLHAHCYVFNATFDPVEQTWKAGQFRELKRDAPYFEAVFHSRLAHRLAELGLPIERTAKGWELAGIDQRFIDKFSRRKAQIEDKARELGIELAEAKDGLGARTREHKQKDLAFGDLQALWRGRMTPQERHALAALEARIGGDAEPADDAAAGRGLSYATAHAFERKSVVAERRLLASALRHSVGKATVEEVQWTFDASDLIWGERHGQKVVTTRAVLAEEQRMIEFAREGRGTCKPFAPGYDTFKRDWLNPAQKNAVRHILESRDRIMIVRGAAGVGKTTLLQEAVEAIENSRTHVLAFAPSADASRGTLREAGFADADTVARLLVDEKLQRQAAGQLILIDEAGLMGMKQMTQVFSLAERLESRVLLSGDRFQHGSVERGAALRLLEQEAGIRPASVKEIQRQQGAYKAAVLALSEGRTAEGFRGLDKLGWIRELPQAERYRQLATDFVETVAAGKTALVVSPTHAEGDRITAEIRQRLKEAGTLKSGEREFCTLESAGLTTAERADAVNYAAGDVLVFHQNAKGIEAGSRLIVDHGAALPLDQAAKFQAFHASTIRLAAGDLVRITHNGRTADGKHRLNNGSLYRVERFDKGGNIVLENGWTVAKDFGHLDYGYCVTSFASQGKSVHRVFVGQSTLSFPASSAEQFYVSASRAKEQVFLYTDNKAALFDAVQRSDDRLSATELVNMRHVIPLREREIERPEVQQRRERDGITYDR